jgi:RNA polymerase sigma factor (sigma-70 family)
VTTQSDEVLFDRLVAGDLGAFDRLYARYERPLCGFIRAHSSDASEVEDLLHETFMTLLRQRGAVDRVRSFRAWLFTVARNLCLKRARTKHRACRAAEAIRELPLAPSPNAEAALAERERSDELERAVLRLPAGLAEVYRLRGSGLSYQELAEVLAVPVGTVKWRVHEMIERLKEEVER